MIIKKEEINKYELNLTTLEIEMKGTTLLIIEGYNAFFMCGALDVDVYNSSKMLERKNEKSKKGEMKHGRNEASGRMPRLPGCRYDHARGRLVCAGGML